MTERDVDGTTEQTAVYAIHIDGVVGPMLVSSLSSEVPAASRRWHVRTEQISVVLISVTDEDLVEVVGRLAASGVEIGCVREIGMDVAS